MNAKARPAEEMTAAETLEWFREEKRRRQDPEAEPLFSLTDMGNGVRLAAMHGRDIRFIHPWQKWLIWDGTRWKVDDEGEIVSMAKQAVRGIYQEAVDELDRKRSAELARFAIASESDQRLKAMIHLCQSELGIPALPDDFDKNSWLLNCPNGTIDLTTAKLIPHRKQDFITRAIELEFDPDATCPRWEKFLQEVFAPHPDIIPFIQRALGYSLTGDTREECLFLLWGSGRNGKGTLIKTIGALLGDYAGVADFSTFIVRRDDSKPRDDVAHMRGKRFVSSQESREGAALAESLIKWLTGGDRVRARRFYENSSEFDPTHKIWLATNSKPIIRGTDTAIWSRIKLVPFSVSFEGKEDKTLKATLLGELPGILKWCLDGCLAWQRDGLKPPEAVTTATQVYRDEMNVLAHFLEDCTVRVKNKEVSTTDLYKRFKRWAEETGEYSMNQNRFSRKLEEYGFDSYEVRRAKHWLGLALLDEKES